MVFFKQGVIIMKYFIVILFILIPFQANAWIINATFENGIIGDKAQGTGDFTEAFGNTRYTNTHAHGGNQAAVTSIKKGDPAFGLWGGAFTFPTKLKEGDEIWYRSWIYLPVGFPFNVLVNSTEGLKLMRIHTKARSGSNEGYIHIYLHGTDAEKGSIFVGSEVNPGTFWSNNPMSRLRHIKGVPPVVTGKWYAFEMYVKFSGIPGHGIYRVWQNGQLILEDTKTATLTSSTSKSDYAYLWSYFNFDADAIAYMDDVIITNEIPSNIDDHGNHFIGIGNATFLARPVSPASVRQQK